MKVRHIGGLAGKLGSRRHQLLTLSLHAHSHAAFWFVNIFCGPTSGTYKLQYEMWLSSNDTQYRNAGYPCARFWCTGQVQPSVACNSGKKHDAKYLQEVLALELLVLNIVSIVVAMPILNSCSYAGREV